MFITPMPARQDTGRRLARGVIRYLRHLDFVAIEEFSPAPGLRVDVMAIGPKGEIWIIECKSGLADFRSDRKWQRYLEYCEQFFWAVNEDFPRDVLPPNTGLILADAYDAEILRGDPGAPHRQMHAARRRKLTLRFARVAADRLTAICDPRVPEHLSPDRSRTGSSYPVPEETGAADRNEPVQEDASSTNVASSLEGIMMRPENLWQNYPKLYHVAWGGSWPGIKERGLLSAKSLLRSYGKTDEEIAALTRARRGHWVEIFCPGGPRAVLRDQKPLTDGGLRSALPDTVEPWQWYDLINSMVFFWPTKARLRTMLEAPAYKGVKHDVLIIDAKTLVSLELSRIRLSRMNSGCTNPPNSRDTNLFKRFEDYPFEETRRKRGLKGAVAEVCVVDRVENIKEAVIDVKHGSAGEILAELPH